MTNVRTTTKDIGEWYFEEDEVMDMAVKLLRKSSNKDFFQCIAKAVVHQFLTTEKLSTFWLFDMDCVEICENVNGELRYKFDIVKLFQNALNNVDLAGGAPDLQTLNKIKTIIAKADHKFSNMNKQS